MPPENSKHLILSELAIRHRQALRPEKNAVSWPMVWPEEVSQMAVSANLDELHLRNTAESWADSAKFRNRLLQHNPGRI